MALPKTDLHSCRVADLLADLDRHLPGVLGRYHRAGGCLRHALACYILHALRDVKGSVSADLYAEIDFDLLLHGTPAVLVEKALGSVPAGMLGALAKSGRIAANLRYYRLLHRTLSDGRSRAALAVRQMRKISPCALDVLHALPEELRWPNVIERIDDRDAADAIAAVWRLIDRHGLISAQTVRSARHAARSGRVERHLYRLALRVPFPLHPVPPAGNYRPITCGAELFTLAREFKNCARYLLGELLDGETHIAVLTLADGMSVIVQTEQRADRVCLSVLGLHTVRNQYLPYARRAEAVAALRELGVHADDYDSGRGQWGNLLSKLSLHIDNPLLG